MHFDMHQETMDYQSQNRVEQLDWVCVRFCKSLKVKYFHGVNASTTTENSEARLHFLQYLTSKRLQSHWNWLASKKMYRVVKCKALEPVAHNCRSLSRFWSMKRLGVFLLPLDEMLDHRRSLVLRNLLGFPNNSQVPIFTPWWREALWEF